MGGIDLITFVWFVRSWRVNPKYQGFLFPSNLRNWAFSDDDDHDDDDAPIVVLTI